MKKFFMFSSLLLAFILSSIKISDAADIPEAPQKVFPHAPKNPYELTKKEDKEVDDILERYGIIVDEDDFAEDDTKVLLTLKIANDIRPYLLDKLIKSIQWSLEYDPLILPRERTRLKSEIHIMEETQISKKQ